MQREVMEYDVAIVGAGPAGLSAAIRLKQLSNEQNHTLSVCVLEKGSEIGAHILSGAVLEPRALNELFEDWQQRDAPLHTPVTADSFCFLTERKSYRMPTPPQMANHGNYIISLGNFCRWLGEQAETLGVDIFPGFCAAELIFNESNHVTAIGTGSTGIDSEGNKTDQYQPGVEIQAKQLLVAEGCRGSLAQKLIEHYNLQKDCQTQTYGLGIKELWEIPENKHRAGNVLHTLGWPLDQKTYGGSFIYHLENNQLAIGFVTGLDYENPYLSPFEEFQRFKTHPAIKAMLEGGQRISYGARALNEGGFQSIPKLSFPGGLLIGCAAGFLNVAKIKGNHTAMKSGMLAAETVFKAIIENRSEQELYEYQTVIEDSWIWDELKSVRNIRPGFKKGLSFGLLNAAFETYITRGKSPWTLKHHPDHLSLKPAAECTPINYPKPDGVFSFDRLSSVYISNTNHAENQPSHLKLKNHGVAISINFHKYQSPEQLYCPAGVYEIVQENSEPMLQINSQNCVHCKTCDIKDPTQNICWTTPEGGGGPNYPNM